MSIENEIDPEIQEVIFRWNKITGRSGRKNGKGPMSEETRQKISRTRQSSPIKQIPSASGDGTEPLSDEHRMKISKGHLARSRRRK